MSMIIMTDLRRYMFYKCFNKYPQFQFTVSTVTGEVSRNVLNHAELEPKPELGPDLRQGPRLKGRSGGRQGVRTGA